MNTSPEPANVAATPTTTTRRTLLTAAAWSAPVVATAIAAPLAAASTLCVDPDVGINWGLATVSGTAATVGRATTLDRTAVFRPQNSTRPTTPNISATVQHTFSGNMRAETNDGTVSAQNVGGIGQRGYQINQFNGPNAVTQPSANDFQTVVFTFAEDLYNVRFSITDIDRLWRAGNGLTRDFLDGVVLESAAPRTFSIPSGSTVTGAGTATSPWYNSVDGNKSEDAPGGQVDVVFAGPVRSFTVRYFNLGYMLGTTNNTVNTDNDQTIFVTGLRVERRAAC
ncbi:hypothetical protein C5E07_18050 [Pseudoclavibacter sp. RFBJ3]|uniref:hypothetical protein n=1 Tax=unclassified Pseudoclavibacter TaxID=2615177 RepID=UPI000CE89343|nr:MULTISPECIES: hypothetical protein [unclassified Pseudoclavibacter]PPF80314.1 hypothetical protein C5C12_17990 [Pseudoclavibacter sp. RFBJ5]PPF89230.1 hypothetical protein C5E07_18050 [Pseudoclavibacter sp. RFBJ3]PPF95767.1 hypothetical protein C5C19_17250 [Pseudoclavibacter sp. RFBH5]PPG25918.1 hypothetical protein C5E13_00895 [Pseudoclavibacter sp. RFBI4]